MLKAKKTDDRMKKRIGQLLILLMLAGSVIGTLAGCGGGSSEPATPVLEEAYPLVKEVVDKDSFAGVYYNAERDILQLNFRDGSDVDSAFDALDQAIDGKKVGTLYFRAPFGPDDATMKRIDERIGSLPFESAEMVGIDLNLSTTGYSKWLGIAPKTERIFVPNPYIFRDYRDASEEDLAAVRVLWIEDTDFQEVDLLPNLEEIGVGVIVDVDKLGSVDELEEEADDTESEEGDAEEEAPEPVYFDPDNWRMDCMLPLRGCSKLERLIILPTEASYTTEHHGRSFLFAVAQTRPDILINPPETPLDREALVPITEVTEAYAGEDPEQAKSIVDSFLKYEVGICYEEAVTFPETDEKPAITGKALVYMGTPNITGYEAERVLHSDGELLTEEELGPSIETPERAGDYQFFVYAYPTYEKVGVYSLGTEAYAETFHVQVFDMTNKIAYKPQLIATQGPPQEFSVAGSTPPARWSGHVDKELVYEAIRKLAK